MKTTRGFTLIELLVVIAIIALLSAVVLSSLSAARAKGNDARRSQEMREIQKAVELYNFEYGHYPISNGTWTSFDSANYVNNPITGTPSAPNLTAALAPFIGRIIDPRTATLNALGGVNASAGFLYWGTNDDYCVMLFLTPENMNNYKANQVNYGGSRCGSIVNGQCTGYNSVYVGTGQFAGGC
jgi:prepilin-type N-terminal cleavage/methylation domain-containing protein